jgi:hypothetical protein
VFSLRARLRWHDLAETRKRRLKTSDPPTSLAVELIEKLRGPVLRGYTVYQTPLQALGRKVAKKNHASKPAFEEALEVLIEFGLVGDSIDENKNIYPWTVLAELSPTALEKVRHRTRHCLSP